MVVSSKAKIPKHLRCLKNNYTGENLLRGNLGDRIVGGVEAQRNSWPWIVRLETTLENGEPSGCGGTLLDSKDSVTLIYL